MNETLGLTWQYIEKWATEKPDLEVIVFSGGQLTWAMVRKKTDMAAKPFLESGVQKGGLAGAVAQILPERAPIHHWG